MRILHVVRQFSPSVGGLEDMVLNLVKTQRDHLGIDARVVTLNRIFGHAGRLPSEEEIDQIKVRRLPWMGSTRYPLAPSVLRHLQSADIVHVHAIDFFFDYLALTRPLHGRRMIASTHGGFFHSAALATTKKVWFNTITRASVMAYDRIVACSHHDAELFQACAGHRLTVIENGINQTKFADTASVAPTRTIISFGRFALHKRLDALFPLLAQLREQDPAWRLIVAGRNADQTMETLHTLAAQSGVTDAVQFVPDPSDDLLRRLIGEASYFISLSAHEGFGLAAVEAMSAGLLPILSGIPPFRRLVSEPRIGLIVDADQPLDAADLIGKLAYEHETDLARSRRKAINIARRYDWDTVARRYGAIYSDVLGAGAAAGLKHAAE